MHSSPSQSQSQLRATPPPDNHRLEYLGDAVVELVVSSHLFHRFPEVQEGILTKLRASVVSKPALAAAARALDLGGALFMSNGESGSGGRDRDSNLADALEAILGAIYLDGGLESAREVGLQLLSEQLENLNPRQAQGNSKGELQEILQQLTPEAPVYEVISEEGPPHDRTFVCAVSWQGKVLGQGHGPSKKSAEAVAAQDALAARIWSIRKESS